MMLLDRAHVDLNFQGKGKERSRRGGVLGAHTGASVTDRKLEYDDKYVGKGSPEV